MMSSLPKELHYKILDYCVKNYGDLIRVRNISPEWRETVRTTRLWLQVPLTIYPNFRIVSLLRFNSDAISELVHEPVSKDALSYAVRERNSKVQEQFSRLENIVNRRRSANISNNLALNETKSPLLTTPMLSYADNFDEEALLESSHPSVLSAQEEAAIAIIEREFVSNFREFTTSWQLYTRWFPTIHGVSVLFKQKMSFCYVKTIYLLYLAVAFSCLGTISAFLGKSLKEGEPIGSVTMVSLIVLIITNIIYFAVILLAKMADRLLVDNIIWLNTTNGGILYFVDGSISVLLLLVSALISLSIFYYADTASEYSYVLFSLPLYIAWLYALYCSNKLVKSYNISEKFFTNALTDQLASKREIFYVSTLIKVMHLSLCLSITFIAYWAQSIHRSALTGERINILYILIPLSTLILPPIVLTSYVIIRRVCDCIRVSQDPSYIGGRYCPFCPCSGHTYMTYVYFHLSYASIAMIIYASALYGLVFILNNVESCIHRSCKDGNILPFQIILFSVLAGFEVIIGYFIYQIAMNTFGRHKWHFENIPIMI